MARRRVVATFAGAVLIAALALVAGITIGLPRQAGTPPPLTEFQR